MRLNGTISAKWFNVRASSDYHFLLEDKELGGDPSQLQEAGVYFTYTTATGVISYKSCYDRILYYHDNQGNIEITAGAHDPSSLVFTFYSVYGLYDQ